jgi:hypothetical protein
LRDTDTRKERYGQIIVFAEDNKSNPSYRIHAMHYSSLLEMKIEISVCIHNCRSVLLRGSSIDKRAAPTSLGFLSQDQYQV